MVNEALCRRILLGFVCSCVVASHAEAVDLCDIINRPKDFDGKTINVQASYRYGFEWQELYCLGCWETGRIWLAVSPEMAKSVQRRLDLLPRNQGTINAVFTGVFHHVGISLAGGSYSDQLVLEDFDRVSVVSRSGAVPWALTRNERAKLCQGRPVKSENETLPVIVLEKLPWLGSPLLLSSDVRARAGLCMVSPAQMDRCFVVSVDGVEYKVAYRSKANTSGPFVTYIYTVDSKFLSPDGRRVGETLELGFDQILRSPGFEVYGVGEKGGWTPVVGFNGQVTRVLEGGVTKLTNLEDVPPAQREGSQRLRIIGFTAR